MNSLIVLAADHNGVALKEKLKTTLQQDGHSCVDIGPYNNDCSVDYVDYARQLGMIIKSGDANKGVLICGTGIGMSIVANKVENIRAALVHNRESAFKTREHNDSNVLCLGAWINTDDENLEITRIWFQEKFGEYRHVKRVEKTKEYPRNNLVFVIWTFDELTKENIELLKFAKVFGGRVVVGIYFDSLSDPKILQDIEERKAILQAIQYVSEVIVLEDSLKQAVKILQPNIIIAGGDFTAEEFRVTEELPIEVSIKIFPLKTSFNIKNIINQKRLVC